MLVANVALMFESLSQFSSQNSNLDSEEHHIASSGKGWRQRQMGLRNAQPRLLTVGECAGEAEWISIVDVNCAVSL
jgi:hypothetical protein